MLTLLILMLATKLRSRSKAKRNLAIFAMLIFSCYSSMGQTRLLNYEVTSNGKPIGTIIVTEKTEGNRSHLVVIAKLKPRLIISIPLHIEEEALLENGIMIRSYYQRKVNGTVTLMRNTFLDDNKYTSVAGNETTQVKLYPLKNNILSLFISEPSGIKNVYSNAMAVMLPIRKISDSVYEILYPDGKRNQYHYKNKVCTRIFLNHNLFKAEVNLKSTKLL